MTRIMYDSTVINDIPLNGAQIIAAYINGDYAADPAQLAARFPNKDYGWCLIDVTGQRADTADMLDVETGDATPATANLWVQSWHVLKRHGLPVIYVNRSNIDAVNAACASGSSKPGTDYGLLVATLDGTQYTGTGVIGCQNLGQAQTGGHYDSSVIYDGSLWQPVTPAPFVTTKAMAEQAIATLTAYVEGS
jgi:hypothetical protein